MKLNAPKQIVFYIAVVLFLVALLAEFAVAALAVANPWLWIVAFVLLALGVILKDFLSNIQEKEADFLVSLF